MENTTKSVNQLQDMFKSASRKRKRSDSPENETMSPAKRRRLLFLWPPMPRTYYLKVKQWHDRKEKIELGKALYWEAQRQYMADQNPSSPAPTMSLSEEALEGIKEAEILIEEITKELEASSPKRQLIKRLDAGCPTDDSLEVKAVPVKRRGGFRRKGEKRLCIK